MKKKKRDKSEGGAVEKIDVESALDKVAAYTRILAPCAENAYVILSEIFDNLPETILASQAFSDLSCALFRAALCQHSGASSPLKISRLSDQEIQKL